MASKDTEPRQDNLFSSTDPQDLTADGPAADRTEGSGGVPSDGSTDPDTQQAAADAGSGSPAPSRPAPGIGLIFQAPEPTVLPPRRRTRAEDEDDQQTAEDTGVDQQDERDDEDDTGSASGRRRGRRGGRGRRSRGRAGGEEGADGTEEDHERSEADSSKGDDRADKGAVKAEKSGKSTKGGRADKGEKAGKKAKGEPDSTENAGSPADVEDAEEAGEGSGSSRRRRRRRRSGSGNGEEDDAPGTVTKVREGRKARDEVASVKGSTRLEAKKQRRREGREAGRRRTIITEAEFLARRESVERTMVVRHRDDRTQIGVLEDGVLVEHYVSRESGSAQSIAGNVYLGRVQNVLPSMEAAFIDIGKGRNAVLYAGEVNWDAAGLENNQPKRIEHALKSGESVLVQVTKDPMGHKGARLTSQVSLPGRYLVYVPGNAMTGISRKLPDTERARLKKILREIVPDDAGVIVRTAAEGASEDELRADVERLTRTWEAIQKKAKTANAPTLLHGEPDLTVRVIRDVFNEDFSSLVVAGETSWQEVSNYVGSVAPDLADRLSHWTAEEDVFAHYRVDEQLAKAMDRKVWLPSGGSLVIDRTEAMTVIDVNTGKFVGSGGNLEETVTKNNIEAAEEIVRQLRLRDIGGIIVIDFIDMVLESNRELVVRRLVECLGRDRTKHQVAEVTSLGLVQMTRKRVGTGLIEVFSETCEHCNGRGIVIHSEPVDKQNGDSGRSRTRKGKSSKGSSQQKAQPEPAKQNNGPTPAQIAAAAHAAALQAATAGGEPEPVAAGAAVDDAAAPDASGDSTPEAAPSVSVAPEQADATAPDAAVPPEASRPTTRRRHKRARVVAPAGPPGQTTPTVADSAGEQHTEPGTEAAAEQPTEATPPADQPDPTSDAPASAE
ncbi:MAG TPA: Rne/Rng family ribonuclease [Segeticoccus sp.]|uniref:Rne/Rng family ribonuclease n=1 Tax=Segeticoccus sp. TaxID=2706531 RepID=UPI002D80D961|nr:Rne/Rng family ribonuclease [Segeticoccus sp.]HET8601674.1 Rne/Rng family ribonuclease [Segeticoccus sp.]